MYIVFLLYSFEKACGAATERELAGLPGQGFLHMEA